jgi:chromosomal replication initiator protein
MKILYTKGEFMTNELIEALQNHSPEEFRAKYRQVDLLLIDDIQFIAGKVSTQEEFFHTFDALHQANKQIVLTSDRPPREISTLEERLRTRFEMGLLADIQPPDLETRIAIIKRKAQLLDIFIGDDVAEYIASQLKSNVRQLEGAVRRMQAQCLLQGESPSLLTAQAAIRDIKSDSQPVPLTVERIINEVARTMSVSPEDVRSNKRSSTISSARQVAEYVVRNITGLPMKAIGEEFGARDHSTVVYAIQKVEEKMAVNPSFKGLVNDIIKNLSGS